MLETKRMNHVLINLFSKNGNNLIILVKYCVIYVE